MQQESPHFHRFELNPGLLDVYDNDEYPTRLYCWNGDGEVDLPANGTSYVFVNNGPSTLVDYDDDGNEKGKYTLRSGMYGAVPGKGRISGGSGYFVTRIDYKGIFSLGGEIEEKGRLRYIDGCSDTLLISPLKKGEACLNHLHFPPGINQTRHTHPTIRCGMVVRGHGHCIVPKENGDDLWIPLEPGLVFVIPVDGQHSFATKESSMDVIAYHPDSDSGPDDDDHPMINRTIVGGTSAAQIAEIRTREISA